MIEKALASAADLVFLDLEDAVAPALKESSRANVVAALKNPNWGPKLRAVRVNAAETRWAHDDVIEVVEQAGEFLDIIILPKVKAPRDVWFFDTLLAQLEIKLRLKNKIGLEALIEETAALARVEEIAACCPRLEAIILGFGDLSASQGVRSTLAEEDEANRYPGDPWHFARGRMIVAARAAGIDAIDGPFAISATRRVTGARRSGPRPSAPSANGRFIRAKSTSPMTSLRPRSRKSTSRAGCAKLMR